ncbi:hypothetical protein B0H16DRAFT_1773906 [Mycena metata]|uniref:Uncharacterized protein n=1 Tax=Mycena metata TaxID=1033252 RepID=A0AAD7HTS7_9AGAR|nr:hypothetical protein B0H16DRAFT_1470579 [Mycena metata]KAJ7730438.1 hypothetical protein B0H16DRAFT_1773906 [Mycena metata]
MWREQYKVEAGKATTVANVLLGLDRFVGSIPAWDARTLYMARVYPYLTAGCDVCLDVNAKSLALLTCLSEILASHTWRWPPQSEGGSFFGNRLMANQVQTRLSRPEVSVLPSPIGRDETGIERSAGIISLVRNQRLFWINDLRIVLSRLYVPVALNIGGDLDVPAVEAAMKCVEKSMEAWIDDEIESSSRVRDLLVDRLEMDSETKKLVKKSLDFRHYLHLASPAHRIALTKMVLSSHSLAIERRRWTERGKKIVPQRWRLCRFCFNHVEDPAHAMFVCKNPELLPIRKMFLDAVAGLLPGVVDQYTDALQTFKGLLAQREVTPLLGKLAHDVLKIFKASPMLCVVEPMIAP